MRKLTLGVLLLLISANTFAAGSLCSKVFVPLHGERSSESYRQDLSSLITWSGGKISDGIFVEEPGVRLLAVSQLTPEAAKSSFAASATTATFLIAGTSLESTVEFLSHAPEVARLTSSKTSAMNSPMYRVQGNEHQMAMQKDFLRQLIKLQADVSANHPNGTTNNEFLNMLNPGSKVTALTLTMSLAQFNHVFYGRIPHDGNEIEVSEVFTKMSEILHERYPEFILAPEDYVKSGVAGRLRPRESKDSKVTKSAADPSSIQVLALTQVLPEALNLFEGLRINPEQSPAEQLAEFRARITYLSFASAPAKGSRFLQKMLEEKSHLSILAASTVTVRLAKSSQDLNNYLSTMGVSLQKSSDNTEPGSVFTLNLRHYYRIFAQSLSPASALPISTKNEMAELCRVIHQLYPNLIPSPEYFMDRS